MQISTKDWTRYINRLRQLDETAANMMTAYVQKYGLANKDALIQYAFGIATKYGEASAELACEMYDAIAEVQAGFYVPSAEPAKTATYKDVAKAVNGTSEAELPGAIGRLVKLAGADTLLNNSLRDGAEFAWIPSGDTCAMCLTIASRGWQKASRNALRNGHAEHIHSHCDCHYAVRFDGRSSVEGYEPNRYKRIYDNAGGRKPSEKINAIRRAQYEENKDKINEQKRAAYLARKNKDK